MIGKDKGRTVQIKYFEVTGGHAHCLFSDEVKKTLAKDGKGKGSGKGGKGGSKSEKKEGTSWAGASARKDDDDFETVDAAGKIVDITKKVGCRKV